MESEIKNRVQEIDELALLAKDGDDGAMEKLVSIISPIAKSKALKMSGPGMRMPVEDLTQEGMLGFLKALNSFEPGRGVPFEAFACICIERQIINAVKMMSNDKNSALTYAVTLDDSLLGNDVDPSRELDLKESLDLLERKARDSFSPFERQVFLLRVDGLSYREISQKLSSSEKAVDNAIQRIKKKLID